MIQWEVAVIHLLRRRLKFPPTRRATLGGKLKRLMTKIIIQLVLFRKSCPGGTLPNWGWW
jgi:hypothetical protein